MDFFKAKSDVARSCVDKQCVCCDEHIELDDDIYADLDETVSQVQHARCFEGLRERGGTAARPDQGLSCLVRQGSGGETVAGGGVVGCANEETGARKQLQETK